MQRDRKSLVWALAALLMVGSLAGGLVIAQSGRTAPANSPTTLTSNNVPAPALGPMIPAAGFAPIVKMAGPSVVSITSTSIRKAESDDNDPFSQFFGGVPGFNFRNGPPTPRSQKAAGSGVIVSPDGYILTNNHVVDDATKVRVALPDKREFDAKVIGKDPRTDLAVIKVEASGLPAIAIGDSSKVEVGDLALAIGNPFDLGQTVTMGIVSALGRSGIEQKNYESFIQTDAAVNPGNSGGALVNLRGELIGINTAILSQSGGNEGIGFAIPSNMARSIMGQIREHGQVTRGYLGVSIQPLSPELASSFNVKDNKGVLVGSVEDNSPAGKAGVERGDVIREVNGEAVNDPDALRFKVADLAPGSSVSLKVLRKGVEKNMTVKVGSQPGDLIASDKAPAADSNTAGKLGVSIQDITPQLSRQLGPSAPKSGVVITQVQPDSPAADSGIRQGDVVEEVNHQAVSSTTDFRNALSKSSDSVLLLINREGKTMYTVVNRAG
jgi:serine protease Do